MFDLNNVKHIYKKIFFGNSSSVKNKDFKHKYEREGLWKLILKKNVKINKTYSSKKQKKIRKNTEIKKK